MPSSLGSISTIDVLLQGHQETLPSRPLPEEFLRVQFSQIIDFVHILRSDVKHLSHVACLQQFAPMTQWGVLDFHQLCTVVESWTKSLEFSEKDRCTVPRIVWLCVHLPQRCKHHQDRGALTLTTTVTGTLVATGLELMQCPDATGAVCKVIPGL